MDERTIEPERRSPSVGAMLIDDKPATSLRFERSEEGRFNLSFLLDSKTVMRLKDLDEKAMKEAAGEKNAARISELGDLKGTLKGSTLASEYGLSPEESTRRRLEQEARATAALQQAEQERLAEVEAKLPDDPTEKNVVSHDPEKLAEIDGKEVLARAAQRREQERLGLQAEGKRIDVENLSEKAYELDSENRYAEHTGANTNYDGQLFAEREKNRQIELMEQVHRQFRVAGAAFHFKDQPQRVAFKDKGARMVSASNDERVAHAMATMAEAKGWKTIRVSGHPDFQREVWMEASIRGIQVRGYEPKEQDVKELNARLDARSRNSVEHEPSRERGRPQRENEAGKTETQESARPASAIGQDRDKSVRTHSGKVMDHGEAPYNHDHRESMNYYVTLATDKGHETVWGIDLKRAMAEGKVQKGDDVRLDFKGKQPVTVVALERNEQGKVVGSKKIETNRNTWEAHKSDKAKVVEAVAAQVLKEQVQDPKQRDAIMQAVNTRLAERELKGRVPSVPVYDRSAPPAQRNPERARPPVERNAERTR